MVGDLYAGGHDEGAAYIYHKNASSLQWDLYDVLRGTAAGEEFSCGLVLSENETVLWVGGHADVVTQYGLEGSAWMGQRLITSDDTTNYFGFAVGLFQGSLVILSRVAMYISPGRGIPGEKVAVDIGSPFSASMAISDSFIVVSSKDNSVIRVFGIAGPSFNVIVIAVTVSVVAFMALVVLAFFIWFRCFRKRESYTKI